jgi:hypothetical protein
MRAAFATADLAAQLIWRAERFLTALFCARLMGAMRVACTQSLRASGSLRAELRALNYSNGTVKKKKKIDGLLNLSEAVVFAFDSSVSLWQNLFRRRRFCC